MTKIGQLYEKEKIEYGKRLAEKAEAKRNMEVAESLLEDDVDILTIMKATGLTKEEILKIKDSQVLA